LGLTIARRIIAAHGGSVQASNRPEGGLMVEIELPIAAHS
jgi:two-component system OmpR family sensor kinase